MQKEGDTVTLTERQEESLDTGRNVVVTAGAGSGKTKVLVERYLSILKDDDSMMPSSILALTFTEKASMEMKERIRKDIQILADESGGRWDDILDDLGGSDISTIHSFCTSLVREDPLSLSLDPDVRVLTENETSRILKDVLRSVFTYDSAVSVPLRKLIVDYGQYTVHNMISGMLRDRARLPHDLGDERLGKDSIGFHDITSRSILESSLEDLSDLKVHLEKLANMIVPENMNDTGVRMMMELLPLWKAVKEGDSDNDILSLISGSRNILLTRGGKPRGTSRLGNSKLWGGDHRDLKESMGALTNFTGEYSDILLFVEKEGLMERARERLEDLLDVVGYIHTEYTSKKRAVNGMDFDDQISYAMELLEREDGRVLNRLRKRYRHVLIDEFQDTDPRQWRLAELLWNEGEGCRLFIVGDPKQSIYGFRSADVRLFLKASGILEEHDEGKVVVLDRNFRSSSEVMDFVNGIFPKVLGDGEGRWSVPFDPLEPHRKEGGSISVVGIIGKEGAEAREGRMAAEMIKRAMRGWEINEDDGPRPLDFSDIAILLPTRKGFQRYEDALREASIPYQVYKGKGYFERQEVIDVLDLMDVLVDPNDDIAMAAVLKGPFFSLSDEDLLSISMSRGRTLYDRLKGSSGFTDVIEIMDAFIEMARKERVPVALERIFEMTGIHATVGGRRQYLNIDKLLEWSMDPANGSNIWEVRESLRMMVDEPPKEGEPPMSTGEDAVTVLTIHAAKGLEWPMVLVLGMNHEGKGDFGSSYRIHPDHGITMKVLDTTTGEYVKPPAWRSTVDEMDSKEMEERKRLFYVACTRARDHLVLSGVMPVDRNGVEREPHGLMKFLKESLDLSVERFDEKVMDVNGVNVRLIPVRPGEISVEESEEELPEYRIVETEIPPSIGILSSEESRFLSPSSTDDGSSGMAFKREMYPEGPAPDDFGDMVHRVLEGIPLGRVVREFGYEDHERSVKDAVETIRSRIDLDDVVREYREIEIVGEVDGDPFKGRCDLILERANGDLEIIDYKTGRKREDNEIQIDRYERMLAGFTGRNVSSRVVYSRVEEDS